MKSNGVYRNTLTDVYETMPEDIGFMLDRFCDPVIDVVWDPFPASTQGVRDVAQAKGYQWRVTCTSDDAFAYTSAPEGTTCIVTNPPFTRKVEALVWLCDRISLPFILLLPTPTLQRDYFSAFLKEFGTTWRFQAILPNQYLGFHRGGEKLHLPIAGTFFLTGTPRGTPVENASTTLPIDIELYDYKTNVRQISNPSDKE